MNDLQLPRIRCSAIVYSRAERFPRPRQCERSGTVDVNGKPYCKQHDPEVVRQRIEAVDLRNKVEYGRYKEQMEDRRVGAWMRRYKPTDYRDILDLKEGPAS